ncbi:hypothetical protein KAI78_03535 [bacterium]|nr:hypothetical protein [bacterium]
MYQKAVAGESKHIPFIFFNNSKHRIEVGVENIDQLLSTSMPFLSQSLAQGSETGDVGKKKISLYQTALFFRDFSLEW